MALTEDRIAWLLEQHIRGTLQEAERLELESWKAASEENRLYFDRITDDEVLAVKMAIYQEGENAKQEERHRIRWDLQKESNSFVPVKDISARTSNRSRILAAASIFIIIAAGILYWSVRNRIGSAERLASTPKHDVVAPIGNHTTLTLADGTEYVLDSVPTGQIATQGQTNINKTSGGQIEYKAALGESIASVLVNTISTSYGGTSKVLLPDGTAVWLNSLSSIKFPTAFAGQNREVSVTGEAYFEVASRKNMPFRVNLNGSVVDVLGTHFDVMAYPSESHQAVTLLEGKVNVHYKVGNSSDQRSVILLPGQQAKVASPPSVNSEDVQSGNNAISVTDINDPEQSIAWVTGSFEFDRSDLQSVLREMERWYNIEVKYKTVPNIHISGSVSKKKNLSEVLLLLQSSGINFSIEGRTVTIE